jgi:hypothetical protein
MSVTSFYLIYRISFIYNGETILWFIGLEFLNIKITAHDKKGISFRKKPSPTVGKLKLNKNNK